MSKDQDWQLLNQRLFWRRMKKSFNWCRADYRPRRHFLWWTNFWSRCVYCSNHLLNPKRRGQKRQDSDRNDSSTVLINVLKIWELNASPRRQDNLLRKSESSSFLLQFSRLSNFNVHKPCRLLHENILRSLCEISVWWTKNWKTQLRVWAESFALNLDSNR